MRVCSALHPALRVRSIRQNTITTVWEDACTGQNATDKNNPGQNATRKKRQDKNVTPEMNGRSKCHWRTDSLSWFTVDVGMFVNCCSYVTKCFNLFIGITCLYLLNSFVNIIIAFLFNIYLRVPYAICLSVLQRKHHKCDMHIIHA